MEDFSGAKEGKHAMSRAPGVVSALRRKVATAAEIARRSSGALFALAGARTLSVATGFVAGRRLARQGAGTVVCVGNGPSLTQEQVILASRTTFVATNRAYQLFDPTCFEAGGRGWIIMNDVSRCLEVLPGLPASFRNVVFACHRPSAFRSVARLWRPGWIYAPIAWTSVVSKRGLTLDENHAQEFSPHFFSRYYGGRSVIFPAIQLAYRFAPRRIVLVGCDMDYSGPVQYSELIRPERHGIGHLGSFDYSEHGRDHMIACREGLAGCGVDLLNATPAGAVRELRRISHEEFGALVAAPSPASPQAR